MPVHIMPLKFNCCKQASTLIENLPANVDRQSQGVHPIAFLAKNQLFTISSSAESIP
jgi:hypothetical protein